LVKRIFREKPQYLFLVKVLIFVWRGDNIHTSEANETDDANQTEISKMHMVILAKKMMLTPNQAIALPEVITSAARECKMSEQQIIQSCYENGEVRDYLASICRKVTA
jgi:hypothetical protein